MDSDHEPVSRKSCIPARRDSSSIALGPALWCSSMAASLSDWRTICWRRSRSSEVGARSQPVEEGDHHHRLGQARRAVPPAGVEARDRAARVQPRRTRPGLAQVQVTAAPTPAPRGPGRRARPGRPARVGAGRGGARRAAGLAELGHRAQARVDRRASPGIRTVSRCGLGAAPKAVTPRTATAPAARTSGSGQRTYHGRARLWVSALSPTRPRARRSASASSPRSATALAATHSAARAARRRSRLRPRSRAARGRARRRRSSGGCRRRGTRR